MLSEQAVRSEGVVDPVAHGMAELGLGHTPVQGEGHDQLYVIDAGFRGHVKDLLDDHLADVGTLHGGQRQGDVVEGDGEAHPGEQQRREWLLVTFGVGEGVADGGLGVGQGLHGLRRIDHPASLRQLLQGEALAVPEEGGGRRLVDIEHESGPGAHRVRPFGLRRSNATLTAPRRPAAPACARASS